MNKYKFKKYKFWYNYQYRREKNKLLKILPEAKIEHVGSTSISGLGGKGIIDLIVAVNKKNWKKTKNILINKGYVAMENASSSSRIALKKIYGIPLFKRRVHIHLTWQNSKTWKEMLNFKRNLILNKELCKEYERIKKEAVKKANGDGTIYREYKNKFIKKHSK